MIGCQKLGCLSAVAESSDYCGEGHPQAPGVESVSCHVSPEVDAWRMKQGLAPLRHQADRIRVLVAESEQAIEDERKKAAFAERMCPVCARESLSSQGRCDACGADLGGVNIELIRIARRAMKAAMGLKDLRTAVQLLGKRDPTAYRFEVRELVQKVLSLIEGLE